MSRPSDETLNRGPDSLWSLKIPGCPSKKRRIVTPASWPNSPTGLWPSWPPNHPHTLIGFITVSSLPVRWCVVGVLVHYGCRHIIQVDAAHWWWMRRYPPYYVKCIEYLEKHYVHVNKIIINYYYYVTDHSTDTNINIMMHTMFLDYCGVHSRKRKLCFKGIKNENGVMLF